jgi:hypothetical protein
MASDARFALQHGNGGNNGSARLRGGMAVSAAKQNARRLPGRQERRAALAGVIHSDGRFIDGGQA